MIILYHGIPRKSSVLIKFFNFFSKKIDLVQRSGSWRGHPPRVLI
nr:MAG TPA: hypothetical protein [Caudoviricetes sp.]